jgi:photosystem II stability/assembly factor-like uncharacterized protein
MYVTASSNNGYWSDDGGQTFHRSARLEAFAFDPHDAAGLHLLGCSDMEIRESRDGGATWTTRGPLPAVFSREKGLPTAVVWSRSNPNTAFIAGPNASIFRSTDRGATWTQVLSADRLPQG